LSAYSIITSRYKAYVYINHGMLHLLGYDHENDQGEMREMEEKLIWRFDLPKSLIIRAESA